MGYIYDSKRVGASRKPKTCASCGKSINVGDPSITITCFNDEFYTEDVCSSECEAEFEANFGNEEDEEDEEEDEEDE